MWSLYDLSRLRELKVCMCVRGVYNQEKTLLLMCKDEAWEICPSQQIATHYLSLPAPFIYFYLFFLRLAYISENCIFCSRYQMCLLCISGVKAILPVPLKPVHTFLFNGSVPFQTLASHLYHFSRKQKTVLFTAL